MFQRLSICVPIADDDEKPKMDMNKMIAQAQIKANVSFPSEIGAWSCHLEAVGCWLLAAPLPQLAAHPAPNKHS